MHFGDVISLYIRGDHHQYTAMGIYMIDTVLSIVFGDHNCHIFPVGCVGEVFDNPANGKIIVGHITFPEWKTGLRPFVSSMIVGDDYRYDGWHIHL